MALIFNGTKYGKPYLDGIKRNTFMQTFNGKNKVWLNTDIITFNFYCADSFDVKPGAITRPNVTLQYKIDGSPWMPYMNDTTLYVPGGKHIYFRGNAYNGLYTSDSEDNAWTINGSNIQIYGSILSLTGGASDALGEYAFSSMLRNCISISQVSDSLLAGIQAIPAYGYASMFANCTSLVNAPTLPATTMATDCYGNMFAGCTRLTSPPALPATQRVDYTGRGTIEVPINDAWANALPTPGIITTGYAIPLFNFITGNDMHIAADNTDLISSVVFGLYLYQIACYA